METGNWNQKLETGNSKLETAKAALVSWWRSLWNRICSLHFPISSFHLPSSNFLSGLPWRLLLGGAALVVAGLWLLEHDARLKQELEFEQQRRTTSAEVAQLRARAETAMQEFRANAQVIASLEARRQALERDAAALRQKLSCLRKEENLRVQQLASLAHVGTPRQTAPGLGPADLATRDPGLGSASDSRPLPLGEGVPPGGRGRVRESATLPSPESPAPSPSLAACREQSAVQEELISNCEQRAEVTRAALEAAKQSALDLQQALGAKDEIAAKLDAQHRAELKAARGSRLRKFARALQYVGVGVVIGVVVAR
jgi:hypothetical protein